jgi:hypothetical protein
MNETTKDQITALEKSGKPVSVAWVLFGLTVAVIKGRLDRREHHVAWTVFGSRRGTFGFIPDASRVTVFGHNIRVDFGANRRRA